jgi:hypothetical protein
MSRFPDNQRQALDLLKSALAALGEDIAKRSATTLPKSSFKQLAALTTLSTRIADARILADACNVLVRNPDLLP